MDTDASDTELWSLALNGDGEAFSQLFDRYRDPVFNYGRWLVRSSQEAEVPAPDTHIAIEDALSACSDLWAQHALDANIPNGVPGPGTAQPNLLSPSATTIDGLHLGGHGGR